LEFAFPHHDINRPYRYRARPSNSRRLPSLAFLPPSTISSTICLASLFHPAAAYRIHSSRDFPFTQPRDLVDPALPPCRFHRARYTSCPVRHLRGSRLQGVAPCESPLSGHWCLAAALPAPFLSFPSSRCCSLSLAREVLPPLPLIALCRICRVIPDTGVQRFETREPDQPLSGLGRPA